MAQTYDTFWQSRFAKRLQEAADLETESLVFGAVEDFASYKYKVGIIRGLNIAHDLISEVTSEINKDKQGKE
jgi:hypothetical protein